MSEAAVPKVTPPKIAPAPLPPPKTGRMALTNVTRGKVLKPVRVLIYGVEGVGKSSFAAAAPKPIFLGNEDGTSQLDVARFPEPHTWAEALEAISELTTSTHDYQTLVIDTLDWLEPLCWTHVCATKRDKKGKKHELIEEFGYGTGYNMALEYWRVLVTALERMRNQRGIHVVLVAHSWIKNFKNPGGEDFDRYQMKLHEKAAGLLREWCDDVLFATYETYTHELNGRAKGISTGARIVQTERTAAWDAKNRHDLPPKLPLDWESYAEAAAEHRPADPARLRARIATLLDQVDETIATKVHQSLARAGDNAAELARIANKLAAMVDAQEHEETEP